MIWSAFIALSDRPTTCPELPTCSGSRLADHTVASMTDHEGVHEAIAAQESLRGTLADDTINMAVAALRAQLERGPAPTG
jgi:hypothetical protein